MVRFTAGSYTVDLSSYQWGYKAGTVYLERDLGTTPSGVFYRQKVGTVSRVLQVRFAQSDTLLSQLRELGVYAGRYGRRVQFFPDTLDLGTFRWLDWPVSFEVRQVVEGRLDIEVPLVEQV